MFVVEKREDGVLLELNNKDAYILLQCLEEVYDKISETDAHAIMLSTRDEIRKLRDQFAAVCEGTKIS